MPLLSTSSCRPHGPFPPHPTQNSIPALAPRQLSEPKLALVPLKKSSFVPRRLLSAPAHNNIAALAMRQLFEPELPYAPA